MPKFWECMIEDREEGSVGTDPAIKLFGQTIAVRPAIVSAGEGASAVPTPSSSQDEEGGSGDGTVLQAMDDGLSQEIRKLEHQRFPGTNENDAKVSNVRSSETVADVEALARGVVCKESERGEDKDEDEDEESQGNGSEDKVMSKPEQVVACPRCDSMDTKFCYYNNYNVNQPRHFCKKCQRYWTAGGTLRNVPVGAGRRKNKHGGLQPEVRSDVSDNAQQLLSCSLTSPTGRKVSNMIVPHGTRMPYSPLPVSDSSPSASKLASNSNWTSAAYLHRTRALHTQPFSTTNFIGADAEIRTVGEPHSEHRLHRQIMGNPLQKNVSGSEMVPMVTNGSTAPKQDAKDLGTISNAQLRPDCPVVYHPTPTGRSQINAQPPYCYFPYGYNVAWNGGSPAAASRVPNPPSMGSYYRYPTGLWSLPPGAVSGQCPPSMLGMLRHPVASPASMATPLGEGAAAATAAAQAAATASGGLSPVKRERSVGGRIAGDLWAPKTLRIDDPEEVARSSVWTRIRSMNRPDPINSGGIFKAFQPKTQSKRNEEQAGWTSPSRHANPAAMTRSRSFQENN